MTPDQITEARHLLDTVTADIPGDASDEEIDRRVHERTVAERTFMMNVAPAVLGELERLGKDNAWLDRHYRQAQEADEAMHEKLSDALGLNEGISWDALVDKVKQLKRGGQELGKVVEFLAELIKSAFVRGADDPTGALNMLGNCLAEMLESEGGLSAAEFNRVQRALDARETEEETRQREGDERRRAEVSRSLAETAPGGAR